MELLIVLLIGINIYFMVRYYETLRPQKQTDATEHKILVARHGADELQEAER